MSSEMCKIYCMLPLQFHIFCHGANVARGSTNYSSGTSYSVYITWMYTFNLIHVLDVNLYPSAQCRFHNCNAGLSNKYCLMFFLVTFYSQQCFWQLVSDSHISSTQQSRLKHLLSPSPEIFHLPDITIQQLTACGKHLVFWNIENPTTSRRATFLCTLMLGDTERSMSYHCSTESRNILNRSTILKHNKTEEQVTFLITNPSL